MLLRRLYVGLLLILIVGKQRHQTPFCGSLQCQESRVKAECRRERKVHVSAVRSRTCCGLMCLTKIETSLVSDLVIAQNSLEHMIYAQQIHTFSNQL